MKPSISEKDLKSAVTSTLRRQHLLGGLPGAQRLLPAAAFAIGDFLAQRSGTNVVEDLLCGTESAQIQLTSSAITYPGKTSNLDVCSICSQRYHCHNYVPLNDLMRLDYKHMTLYPAYGSTRFIFSPRHSTQDVNSSY